MTFFFSCIKPTLIIRYKTDTTLCTNGICPASPNGALSLFSTNISLKQLVGFAVVMMAAGIL